jgi:xyloglucan-specific endo-beta-1,4-glucanase
MSVASSPAPGTNLSDKGVMANVVIDLFADADAATSLVETQAGYEIMVWIAVFGGAKPLGYYSTKAPPLTASIGSTQL